ncbi:hypothetical protein UFOVP190_151 [uncultured Caudovirales phage]|jgi:hypothetical protein|uniref:Uncharacterized protein n=1 Tax=uncultured Caudovirales phage TaxID=2100421 RepID=A0A6J7WGM4_9CAUD|nr:hypothetical protein UFOVP190_151 [uncultured Caudovirales phage]
MTIINIEAEHGLTRLEIIDNPFTTKYIEQFKHTLKTCPALGRHVIYGVWFSGNPGNALKECHERLTDVIAELNAMGTNFPYESSLEILELRNTESQSLLNKLHRAFTTADRSRTGAIHVGQVQWSDKFPSSFTVLPEKADRFRYLIEQVNHLVHKAELWCKTDRKQLGPPMNVQKHFKFNGVKHLPNQVEFYANVFTNNSTRLMEDNFFSYAEEDYNYCSDSKEFDVWVGKDILGKDYLVAYYEHDDAGEWDVRYNVGYTAKLAVDIFDVKRADIINTDDFRAWLDEGGVKYSPAICGMPLGRYIEGKAELETYISTTKPFKDIKITIE